MNITSDSNPRSFFNSCPLRRYDIVAEKLNHPELGEYHTYGIQIAAPEHTDILHDVSVCKETTERIVTLLNKHQVSPVHLKDIVTDMLL